MITGVAERAMDRLEDRVILAADFDFFQEVGFRQAAKRLKYRRPAALPQGEKGGPIIIGFENELAIPTCLMMMAMLFESSPGFWKNA